MKILPSVELLPEYIKLKYFDKCIVSISTAEFSECEWLQSFIYDNGLDWLDLFFKGYILLEFNTEKEGMDFIKSVPDSTPYCCLYYKGKYLYENT